MTYEEFVWFLIAEEDKRQPRRYDLWHLCIVISDVYSYHEERERVGKG